MGKTIGVVLALKDKCSPQLEKIAKKMNIGTNEAKRLHAQAKKLSRELGSGLKKAGTICAGALAGVTVATQQLVSKTIEAGDRVDKMSQKIGMSRQAFQEWDYIMSQNGGSVESLQMGYKTLTNQMANVNKGSKESTAIFKKLGVSVKDSNGQLRSQEEVFNDSVRAIQNLKNPTEKAIISNKLFGRSAIEMKPLLNQSAESVDALRQKANDLGMVMSDDTVDGAVKLQDTLDTMQRTFNGLGMYIGSQFLPIIQSISDKIIANMPQIKATIFPIAEKFVYIISGLVNHLDILIAVSSMVVKGIIAFNVIKGAIISFNMLTKAVQLLTIAFNLNPIGFIITGVALLTTGIILLVKNWDKVTASVTKAFNIMKKILGLKPINGVNVTQEKPEKIEKPKKHALGTSFSSGGLAVVGEHGRELVNLNRGASVTPNDKTEKLLQGNQKVNISVNIAGNLIGNDEFLNKLKNTLALELKQALATT